MFFSSRKKAAADAVAATAAPAAAAAIPSTIQPQTTQAPVQEAAAVVPEPARATAVPTAPAATGGDTPAQLTPEQIKAAAIRSQRDFTLFGEIASVFMRSPEHKQMTLTELERLVVPAIATRQFLVAMAQSKSTGKRYPVAVLLWASVSPEIDRRLAVGGDKQYPLEAKDWKSGDIPWLLGAAGNPQLFGGMLKQLQSGALKGRSIKFQTPGDNGGAQVTALAAE